MERLCFPDAYLHGVNKRRPAVIATLLLASAVTAALTACVSSAPPQSTVTAVPSTTPMEPVAADRTALLQEALAVFDGYNRAVAQVMVDDSIDASVIRPFGTDTAIEEVRHFRDSLQSRHQRLVGVSESRNALLQDVRPSTGKVEMLVCAILDNVRLLDETGADVTPPDRPSLSTHRITFQRDEKSGLLQVEEGVVWEGASVC